jgi:hypothetical protein
MGLTLIPVTLSPFERGSRSIGKGIGYLLGVPSDPSATAVGYRKCVVRDCIGSEAATVTEAGSNRY